MKKVRKETKSLKKSQKLKKIEQEEKLRKITKVKKNGRRWVTIFYECARNPIFLKNLPKLTFCHFVSNLSFTKEEKLNLRIL
jgi:hypothetical protein